MISFDEFKKVELRVGKVVACEPVEGSEKLLKLSVDIGEKDAETGLLATRQVLAGIAKEYKPEDLVGKEIVIVANLEPRALMGLESQGMILCANDTHLTGLGTGVPVIVRPDRDVAIGSEIR